MGGDIEVNVNEQNPYTPPNPSSADSNDRHKDPKESRKVRILAAIVALFCMLMPLSVDFRRLNFDLMAVLVIQTYAAFAFGSVAVTGRWFSFKRILFGTSPR